MLGRNQIGAVRQFLAAADFKLGAANELEPPQAGKPMQPQTLHGPASRCQQEPTAAHQKNGGIDVEDGGEQERAKHGRELPCQMLRASVGCPQASAWLSHCRSNRATPKRAADGRNLRYSVNSKRKLPACSHQRSARKACGTTG